MAARRSTTFLILLVSGAVFTVVVCLYGNARQREDIRSIVASADAVRTLGLTDLCLFTEARYMRHLSQADLHAAFQDHPAGLDHFPSGSFGGYAVARKGHYEPMD